MADNEEVKPPVEHVINIRLPDVITGGMYEAYMDGCHTYQSKRSYASSTITRFYGACALYKQGYVVVSGYQPLLDALKAEDHKTVPGEILGWIEDEIGVPVETSVSRPLSVSWRLLWPTDPTRINDTVLPPLVGTSKPEIIT